MPPASSSVSLSIDLDPDSGVSVVPDLRHRRVQNGNLDGSKASNRSPPRRRPAELDRLRGLPARFELIRLLGKGAMGQVFLAKDLQLGRKVAIKVLEDATKPQAATRIVNEARILASLRHPHVVRIYSAGRARGQPYLVLEYVDGLPLIKWSGRGVIGPAMLSVAEALDAAHGVGVLHRDVKPDNVLLARDGRPVLIDFGLARSHRGQGLTGRNRKVGTFHFLAPEVLGGGDYSRASDWYAWGATLFMLVEGRTPYSTDDKVRSVRSGKVPEVRFERIDPGGRRATLIRALLSSRPEARPAGAVALRRWLHEGPPRGGRGKGRPSSQRVSKTGVSARPGRSLSRGFGRILDSLGALLSGRRDGE